MRSAVRPSPWMRLSRIELQHVRAGRNASTTAERRRLSSGRCDLHSVSRANWSPRFNNRPEIFDLRKNWC